MDLHDVWQENKRWILGIVLGLLVYWIGDAAIAGMYDSAGAHREIRRQKNQLQDDPKYDRELCDGDGAAVGTEGHRVHGR